jgi:hypothetical protein
LTKLQLLSWNLPNPLEQQERLERELMGAADVKRPVTNKILTLVEEEIEPIRDDTLSAVIHAM